LYLFVMRYMYFILHYLNSLNITVVNHYYHLVSDQGIDWYEIRSLPGTQAS
jgi:hypothetical protein